MDIAQLGFRIDTGDLDKASTKLNVLKAAASGMTTASAKVSATVEGSFANIAQNTVAIARAYDMQAGKQLKAAQSAKVLNIETINAAAALKEKTRNTLNDAIAEEKRTKKLLEAVAAQKGFNATQRIAFGKISSTRMANGGEPNSPIPRDMMPNRFNTANIAAQFQDIAVTASMGMNPMLIALQQGTQVSAILNSMENPLKGIAQAFRAVINPISILSIGLVGLAAAGLQFVDWTKTAQAALNGIATVIETTLPYVAALGAGLALIYSGTIYAGISAVTLSIYGMGKSALIAGAEMVTAWLAGLGPLGLLLVAVTAIGTTLQLLGADVIGAIKGMVNYIVGGFYGAFNSVKEIWSNLARVMGGFIINTVNVVLSGIEKMINGSVGLLNSLLDAIPEWAKPDGARISWKADIQVSNPYEKDAADAGSKIARSFSDAMKQDYVGSATESIKEFGSDAANKIRQFASGLGADSAKDKKGRGGKTDEEKYEDLINGAKRRIETLKAEQAAIGMTEEAAARLRYETDLLNDANQKGINLSPAQREAIKGYASDMAAIEEQTYRTRSALDLVRDVSSGFFQDMRNGLQEGKGLWESFGDAVKNVLNKILDAMLDSGINNLMSGLFGSPTGVGGSAGGDLLSSIGSFLFSAKGNAFTPSGVHEFAKGGAFTNSIVNRATPFAFAGGGAFGVMGEKGAEAVMPLHRGPDGSLGVRMAGGGANDNNIIVNINNFGDAKVSTQQRQTGNGLEIDVMIDEMVSQKVAEQGSSINRSLNARDSRRLIAR